MVLTTHQNSSESAFCQLATGAALENLRNNLPVLQLHTPFSAEGMNNSGDARLLQAYYDFYGFDVLRHIDSRPSYYFGSIAHHDLTLASHVWHLESSREFVFVAHGLFDHVGLYLKLVSYLLGSGFSVVAVDMPGHGLSSGAVGVISDFADYASAISCTRLTISKLLTGKMGENNMSHINWSAVGQSTGSAALMRFLFSENEGVLPSGTENFSSSSDSKVSDPSVSFFNKVVLIAPLVKPKSWWRVFASFILLSKFLPSIKRKFTENSHDKEFISFLRELDPLQAKHISVEWVGAMIQWVASFSSFSSLSIPTLIVQGTADKTVDFVKNIPLIQSQFSNTEVFEIEDAMHHLVNESDKYRLPAFKKIVAFLK